MPRWEDNILAILNQCLGFPHRHFVCSEAKVDNGISHSTNYLEVTEYECKQNFDWSLNILRKVTLEPAACGITTDEYTDFCTFIHGKEAKTCPSSRFLLNIKHATVISSQFLSTKKVPDIFQREARFLSYPYILTKTELQTSMGTHVMLYGDSLKLPPLLTGVSYQFTDIELTVSEPFIGWIGHLSKAIVIDIKNYIPSVTDLSMQADIKSVLMWDVIKGVFSPETCLIEARILKLIKLEISLEQNSNHKLKQESSPSAKLVMSMDDSSCGFLGTCYDHVVAYILGISQQAWLELAVHVTKNGNISLMMKPSEGEGAVETMLRGCFKRSSLQNSREMLVTVLKESNQQQVPLVSDRTVPFRSCIDEERNIWATFKTRVHRSVTVKVINVRRAKKF